MTVKNAKFEFTGETKIVFGVTVNRIRAVAAIAALGVAVGDLGGWIESKKNLSVTGNAWVSGNARVYGDALVSGDAWVTGYAQVYDNAQVYGDAQVSDYAQVYDNAQIYGDAQVSDDAQVYGDAQVSGDALVTGNARISENARVTGYAQVYGNAWVSGNARVYGDALVYGDAQVYGDALVYGDAWVTGNALVTGVNITAMRSDGYTFTVAPTPDGPRVMAGCRYFSFDEASTHWLNTRGGTKLGDETASILTHLKRMAELNGFMEPVASQDDSEVQA